MSYHHRSTAFRIQGERQGNGATASYRKVQCPRCHRSLKVPENLVSRPFSCPACQQGILLPATPTTVRNASPRGRHQQSTFESISALPFGGDKKLEDYVLNRQRVTRTEVNVWGVIGLLLLFVWLAAPAFFRCHELTVATVLAVSLFGWLVPPAFFLRPLKRDYFWSYLIAVWVSFPVASVIRASCAASSGLSALPPGDRLGVLFAFVPCLLYAVAWFHADTALTRCQSQAQRRMVHLTTRSHVSMNQVIEKSLLSYKVLGGDHRKALEALSAGLSMTGGDPRLLQQAGLIMRAGGRSDEARQFFDRAAGVAAARPPRESETSSVARKGLEPTKVKFACGHCGQQYEVQTTARGKLCQCKKCGQPIRVPKETANDGEDGIDLAAAAAMEGSAVSGAERLCPTFQWTSGPRARQGRSTGSGPPTGIVLRIVAAFLLCVLYALSAPFQDHWLVSALGIFFAGFWLAVGIGMLCRVRFFETAGVVVAGFLAVCGFLMMVSGHEANWTGLDMIVLCLFVLCSGKKAQPSWYGDLPPAASRGTITATGDQRI